MPPERSGELHLDATSLRVIAHPVRIKIMGILRSHGPQTSTTLADRLGLNSGATSYHLRQLAEHGMIVEESDCGTARERWWKVPSRGTRLDYKTLDDEGMTEAAGYLHALCLVYSEHLQRAAQEFAAQPEEWRTATTFSDYLLRLNPTEAKDLLTQIREILERHRAYDDTDDGTEPPNTQAFHVQLQAFLQPGN